MPSKPEQIMTLLRQMEVVIANGKLTPEACREAGISEQTFIAGARNMVAWTMKTSRGAQFLAASPRQS
jgi:hypothetical protein